MDEDIHLEGQTESGADIVLYVEQEASVSYVSVEADHIGYLRFNFNPDFPQDARRFYDALLNVRSIIAEDM
jgi:hypothetical protein